MMMNKKKPFSLHLDVDSFMPATAEEKEVISRMRPSSTFFRDGVKRLLKNKVATIKPDSDCADYAVLHHHPDVLAIFV